MDAPTSDAEQEVQTQWDDQIAEEQDLPDDLTIVFVAAEVAPWSQTGGLGDVAGQLPKELAALGHRVMVVAPR